MTKKEKLERLLDLGATPEAIAEYLNVEISMVNWMIEQVEKEREQNV